MRLIGVVVAAAAAILSLASCASDGSAQQESSIPWNRPQKWEGPGVLGSAFQQGGGY